MWTAQTITPLSDPPPPLAALKANFSAYGLGWGLTDYRGKKVVSHTGGLPGYVSRVALIPDLKLGVVVLTNQESGGAFQSIVYRVFDYYLGAPDNGLDGRVSHLEETRQSKSAPKSRSNKQPGARRTRSPRCPLPNTRGDTLMRGTAKRR